MLHRIGVALVFPPHVWLSMVYAHAVGGAWCGGCPRGVAIKANVGVLLWVSEGLGEPTNSLRIGGVDMQI